MKIKHYFSFLMLLSVLSSQAMENDKETQRRALLTRAANTIRTMTNSDLPRMVRNVRELPEAENLTVPALKNNGTQTEQIEISANSNQTEGSFSLKQYVFITGGIIGGILFLRWFFRKPHITFSENL